MCVNWNELRCASSELQPVATRLPGVRLPLVFMKIVYVYGRFERFPSEVRSPYIMNSKKASFVTDIIILERLGGAVHVLDQVQL